MLDSLQSLVDQPWTLSPRTLLGALTTGLIAAFVGELLWRAWRWPRLMGFAAVGTLLALAGLGFDGGEPGVRLVVDAALAVLLFEAGARLNLRWLRDNPWLLASSLLESMLGAAAVWSGARALGLDSGVAVPLALVAMAGAPALVLRVVGELGAAGQVTERLTLMSVVGTLVAILALQLVGAGLLLGEPDTWTQAIGPVVFSFVGSIVLAAMVGEAVIYVARHFDLRHDHGVLLMVGFVLLALVLAKTLHLSTLIVPLLAGIWLRNRSERPWIWPRHFGSLGSALVLALFVIVSAAWSPAAVAPLLVTAVALVALRALAKLLGVLLLARPSGLAWRQAVWLGLALSPMSATAWVLGLDFAMQQGARADGLLPMLLACVAVFELVAPLILMACLRQAGEVDRGTAPRPHPQPPREEG